METENIFSFYYSTKESRILKSKDKLNNWSLLAAIGLVAIILTIAALVV